MARSSIALLLALLFACIFGVDGKEAARAQEGELAVLRRRAGRRAHRRRDGQPSNLNVLTRAIADFPFTTCPDPAPGYRIRNAYTSPVFIDYPYALTCDYALDGQTARAYLCGYDGDGNFNSASAEYPNANGVTCPGNSFQRPDAVARFTACPVQSRNGIPLDEDNDEDAAYTAWDPSATGSKSLYTACQYLDNEITGDITYCYWDALTGELIVDGDSWSDGNDECPDASTYDSTEMQPSYPIIAATGPFLVPPPPPR